MGLGEELSDISGENMMHALEVRMLSERAGIGDFLWLARCLYTLPETNQTSKNRLGPKRTLHLPTINFQVLCFREGTGVFRVYHIPQNAGSAGEDDGETKVNLNNSSKLSD